MNGLIAWFIHNRVAANMLMFIIVAAGIMLIPETKKEILPNVSLDKISITAAYPGASPTEVEEAVCMPLERAITGLQGIKDFHTAAKEQLCIISMNIEDGIDGADLLDKIKGNVGAISSFPSTVARPITKITEAPNNIASLVIAGNADYATLKTIAGNVRDELINLGVSRVRIRSNRSYEISIEVSEEELQRYNMSLASVAQAIRRNSMKASGGSVSTSGGSISVEAVGQAYNAEDFRNLILLAQPDGGHVSLGDISTIRDGLTETNQQTFFDGKPAIMLNIGQGDRENLLDLAQTLHEYAEKKNQQLTEGITVSIDGDTAKYFERRIELLVDNAISGLALVFITLLLFMTLRLSLWVSLGIPVAFLGGFVILYLSGGSINMISTFALLIVLGIVVDDAIIVGENIHRHHTLGSKGEKGAIIGVQEISKPVIFAVLTTAVSFTPMFFLPGSDGKLMSAIPIVVIGTLFFSLVESLLILPSHLTHSPTEEKRTIISGLQNKFSSFLDACIERGYRPMLNRTLIWRYTALSSFFMVFFISTAIIAGGWISIHFFSSIEADLALGRLGFPQGTSIEVTRDALKRIENAALEVQQEMEEKYHSVQIEHVRTQLATSGDNSGLVSLTMTASNNRLASGKEILDLWRKKVGTIPRATQLSFSSTFNNPGPPIKIQFTSYSMEKLRAASEALRDHIAEYPAAYGIRDSFQGGKREVQLELKPHAHDLGLDLQSLAGQIHQAFQGINVQSVQRDQNEVKVVLRYPPEERNSLWHFENMLVRLSDGSHIPLMSVANIYYGQGPTTIARLNGKRILHVSAYVDEGISSANLVRRGIMDNFLVNLEDDFPGVRWGYSGMQKNESELKRRLTLGFISTLLVMYMLMAVLFHSYLQPILVMTAIPFGMIGALFGHLLMGVELTLWSAAGMIAVSGVVVNDNMVLIFYINEKREAGVSLLNAIKEAGEVRFRPIMLTSITTFVGLTPLMLNKSFEAQFLVPMAISISFGVLFATLVSLFLVPALYLVLNDLTTMRLPTASPKNQIIHLEDDDVRYNDDGVVVQTKD